ncbi:hypothetical protein MMC32_000589 [Xylographa parallela]|nr:hypothetical protein [Xylographa parallela]
MTSTPKPTNNGPTIIHLPKGPIVADVVLVHGYGGDRLASWTSEDAICWPRNLLPLDVPDARVILWGYDTSSALTIDEHAHHLLLALEDRRPARRGRPLIFVGISLGGLIIKQALVLAVRRMTIERDLRSWNVWRSTLGTMLIGTLRRDEKQNPPPGVKLFEGWGPEDEKVKVHRETWAYIAKNLASYQCCAERPGRSPLPVEPDYVEGTGNPSTHEELGFGIFTDREDPGYQSLVQMMQHMFTFIVDEDEFYDE